MRKRVKYKNDNRDNYKWISKPAVFVKKLTDIEIQSIKDNAAELYASTNKWYILEDKAIGTLRHALLAYLLPEQYGAVKIAPTDVLREMVRAEIQAYFRKNKDEENESLNETE